MQLRATHATKQKSTTSYYETKRTHGPRCPCLHLATRLAAVLIEEDSTGLFHIWVVLCSRPVLVTALHRILDRL